MSGCIDLHMTDRLFDIIPLTLDLNLTLILALTLILILYVNITWARNKSVDECYTGRQWRSTIQSRDMFVMTEGRDVQIILFKENIKWKFGSMA